MFSLNKVVITMLVLLLLAALSFSSFGETMAKMVSVLVEPSLVYEKVYDFNEGLSAVYQDDRCGFIDKTGELVIPIAFEGAGYFFEGLARVKKDDRWGFINKSGELVIDYQYDHVKDFKEGRAAVNRGSDSYGYGGKWGYINKTGEEIVPLVYDNAGDYQEGLAPVAYKVDLETDNMAGELSQDLTAPAENDKKEAVQAADNAIIALPAIEALTLDDKPDVVAARALVDVAINDYGASESDFEYLANLEAAEVRIKELEGIIPVPEPPQYRYEYGYLDRDGELAIPFRYDQAGPFTGGYAAVSLDYRSGIINRDNQTVVPFNYSRSQIYHENLFFVIKNTDSGHLIGYYNHLGEVVIEPKYSQAEIRRYSEGLIAIREEIAPTEYGKYSFYDDSGQLAFPGEFTDVREFSEDLAAVKNNGKWGYINNQGELVIPYQFDDVSYFGFQNGYTWVTGNGKILFIDRGGDIFHTADYDYIRRFHDGIAYVYKNNLAGIIEVLVDRSIDPEPEPEPDKEVSYVVIEIGTDKVIVELDTYALAYFKGEGNPVYDYLRDGHNYPRIYAIGVEDSFISLFQYAANYRGSVREAVENSEQIPESESSEFINYRE